MPSKYGVSPREFSSFSVKVRWALESRYILPPFALMVSSSSGTPSYSFKNFVEKQRKTSQNSSTVAFLGFTPLRVKSRRKTFSILISITEYSGCRLLAALFSLSTSSP